MSLSVLVYLVTYAAAAAFVLAVVIRFVKFQSMPLHLRWELYPVAHEPGKKAEYGGSFYEKVDWWTKPMEKSVVNELKAMLPEMLFLVALFEHNRKLWWRSFPFHFGLYLLIATMGLFFVGTLIDVTGVGGAGLGVVVEGLILLFALVGLTLATLGALGLLERRVFDPDLSDYTAPADVFNLVAFVVVLAGAWVTVLVVDPSLVLTQGFVRNLITLNVSEPIGSQVLAVEILLAVVLIAYIPMTHMSHFFLKWFTWHKIRWDDEVNIVGGKIEKKITEQVSYPVSWSAPHINADGKKNWVDIATEEITENEKETDKG